MSGNGGDPSQITLLLRLLGGGYLLYLGSSILMDGTESFLIAGGAAIFILSGAGLLAITLPTILRQIKGIEDPGRKKEQRSKPGIDQRSNGDP